MSSTQNNSNFSYFTFLIAVVLIASGIYGYLRLNALSTRIDELTVGIIAVNDKLASTTNDLTAAIQDSQRSLSKDLSDQKQNVGSIQQQLGGVQGQVGSLSGSLNNLQKLAQTDPELLKKYSKVYFLNENYVPTRLAEIPGSYVYSDSKQILFQTNALPKLESMIDTASSSGVRLYISSAYRSFAEQRALKGDYRVTYGAGTANSFSADQGYSEHQLGTAVDMITSGVGGDLDKFENSKAFTWMTQNAYKFGFTLSYPKSNTYYVYEPWHWRYVGVRLATDLFNQNKHFYDLDQRTIDTYLINIFD